MGQTSINLIQQLIQSQQSTITQLLQVNSYLSSQIAEIAGMISSNKSLEATDKELILNEIFQKQRERDLLSSVDKSDAVQDMLKNTYQYKNVYNPPTAPIATTTNNDNDDWESPLKEYYREKETRKKMRDSQQKQKDNDTMNFTTADKLLMDNDDESAGATGLGNEFGEKHKR